MTELAFEYALQRWSGVAEFRQAAGLDGRLPAPAAQGNGDNSGPRPAVAPEPTR